MPGTLEAPGADVAAQGERTFAVIGNPNAGKTTLFNALTGLRQKVGNYAGVTVERKEGIAFSQHGKPMRLIDLPGSYSLNPRSPDEAIMQESLLGRRPENPVPDGIICVVEAANLERGLYLATQVAELGIPLVLALNMLDEAAARGIRIDAERLERELGVPVVTAQGRGKPDTLQLRLALSRSDLPKPKFRLQGPPLYEEALRELAAAFERSHPEAALRARGEAIQLLESEGESEAPGARPWSPELLQLAASWRARLEREVPGWHSELVALRYARIGEICRAVVEQVDPDSVTWTERIDRILLHPVVGLSVLAAVMGLLFWSVFKWATLPMDWIDAGIGWLGETAANNLPPGELTSLLVDGVIAGVGGVVIFLPQILLLFFFVSLLESTGYMARAAFILDRVMSKVGLHGRAFIPLLSSYACAVPGIMAARTIESPKDRLVTILVAPFMTCSARLPVYLVMIATLMPADEVPALQRAGLLLLFYFLGTITAFLFALAFKSTLLRGLAPPMILELPPYRWPSLQQVARDMLERGGLFLRRAGTIILGLSILLWFFLSYPKPPEDAPEEALAASFAGQVGQLVEPLTDPLGWDWRINIGTMASFAAREVFVSTMAIVYEVEGGDGAEEASLVETLRAQTRPDGTRVFTPLTCLSILVFFVFALQCLSTVAVVKRETNSWFWPTFQLAFMTATAYLGALLVYQGGKLLGFS